MVRLAAVWKSVTAPQTAQLFVDNVFRHHGLPEAFVSDRDPRLVMSTAGHCQADSQTERVNRVLEDILRSGVRSFHKWSLRSIMLCIRLRASLRSM
ncbi:hypothetical protein PF003_g1965 [Phytophthora fragariae]|nr:hypothetical protein PF003_g1965 [Phytophthora fragariae]